MTRRPTELFGAGLASLRRQGAVATALEAARRAGLSPRGHYYYHRARRRAPDGPAGIDPFRTFEVDPNDVEWLPAVRFDKWRNLGEVRDGDWDEPLLRFEATPVHRTLRQRFEEGRDWEETELYRSALARAWRGKRGWHGCTTEAELEERCAAVDALYERMASDGYRSQAELTGLSTADRLRSGTFDRFESDVSVHVARDGAFRFVDGRHRLSIARLLDLDAVTVQPVVRHRDWQRTRRRVRQAGIDAVSPDLRDHPDLLDVRG